MTEDQTHTRDHPIDALTLEGLRYVEVETSRFCNRRCPWCPNGHTRARREQQLMDWEVFTKITAELGAFGYDGFFAFHNYNEPLANARLFDEIARLRKDALGAKPAIYTNGDLLTRDLLNRMVDAGVAYLRITRYPRRADEQPTFEDLHTWLSKRKLLSGGIDWQYAPVRQGLAATWQDAVSGMKVEVIRPQISSYNDRGGTATVPRLLPMRTEPCRMTETSISVDYRGQMKMCCNVAPEPGQHQQYIVGYVADFTLAELWNSPSMVDWRNRHAKADWSRSAACRTCVQALPETRQ
ncbi:radical SAM protein [Streptomyces roseoverticillatus]|uniref:radical SAM/SPASM domain-containing protein n=1 Tax=Streptomyces roseoverticillatus TaxID=66429 RepID=UPI001F20A4A3|nr:radical SAM/SPASM domain-containing protein [Streptomyces roseoverticillatus]MCF3100999.1 radical SAM protein [Streptomyces roseoverticillatus]